MKPIRYATNKQVREAAAWVNSVWGPVLQRLTDDKFQDHYQHMRDEQSHPEDDSADYDD